MIEEKLKEVSIAEYNKQKVIKLVEDEEKNKLVSDLINYPHAFVLACAIIAKHAKEIGLNVWCYTGFTYEEVLKSKDMLNLLKYVDVLVDGKFKIDELSLNLDFRGSRNQRIIDVQQSLKENKVIILEKYMKERNHIIEVPREKHVYI